METEKRAHETTKNYFKSNFASKSLKQQIQKMIINLNLSSKRDITNKTEAKIDFMRAENLLLFRTMK
jgi:hypothetical protein